MLFKVAFVLTPEVRKKSPRKRRPVSATMMELGSLVSDNN